MLDFTISERVWRKLKGDEPPAGGGATGPEAETGDHNGDEPGDESPEHGKVEFSEAQQAYLNRLVGKAREEGRKAAEAKAAEERRKAEQEAERKRLEEKEEFKTLAEKYKDERDDLEAQFNSATETAESLQAKLERYEQVVTELVERQTEGLPEATRVLLDKMDVLERLDWLAQYGEDAKAGRGPGLGTPPSKRQGGADKAPSPGKVDDDKAERAIRYVSF